MTPSSSPKNGSVLTRVTFGGTEAYPAVVDPANRWNGFVSPFFTLDAVRLLSAESSRTPPSTATTAPTPSTSSTEEPTATAPSERSSSTSAGCTSKTRARLSA